MTRAINVVQRLWSTGISADITYDVSQVRERLYIEPPCNFSTFTLRLLTRGALQSYIFIYVGGLTSRVEVFANKKIKMYHVVS